MRDFSTSLSLIATSILLLSACAVGDDFESHEQSEDSIVEPESSLEQMLSLVPQVATSDDLVEGQVLDGTRPRYVVLDTRAGSFDLGAVEMHDVSGIRSLAELFVDSPIVQGDGQLGRDALLLFSVPEVHVQELCARFQSAHSEGQTQTIVGETAFFLADAPDGTVHALCVAPQTTVGATGEGAGPLSDLVAEDDTQGYGWGSYTVHLKTLECNNPHDWENWPYTGDKARLYARNDGASSGRVWSKDKVESGESFSVGRFVHFNANARINLWESDSGLAGKNDHLGQEWIYADEACAGNHYGDFDGSGGGHGWNYDLTYKVYGPECPCQDSVAPVHNTTRVQTCATTGTTITHYTSYCVGTTSYRQAWGTRTRFCETHDRTYNTACEQNTFVSETLVSDLTENTYGVPLGSPEVDGFCPGPPGGGDGPCLAELEAPLGPVDDLYAGDQLPPVQPLIQPIDCFDDDAMW